MPNADQCQSMPINADQNHGIDPKCLGIDRHWSELIDIGINARILIGIDQHWSALGIDRGSPDNVMHLDYIIYCDISVSKDIVWYQKSVWNRWRTHVTLNLVHYIYHMLLLPSSYTCHPNRFIGSFGLWFGSVLCEKVPNVLNNPSILLLVLNFFLDFFCGGGDFF